MICQKCKERRHDECRGGSWCDCQHQPPRPPEPPVGWRRQG
ncbi:hypothetical protein [Spongiactinospora rosea]|nr:hypothetical protein [Spongiactinospora rosea]